MARYVTDLFIPVGIDATFAYVSDFRHATWDPRVSQARRTDGDGPIGVGATFELTSPLPLGSTLLPYRIVAYEAPRKVVLTGQTWYARYTDTITLSPAEGGTTLHYDAVFSLRGLLAIGGPIMQILFRKVGDDATRGIPDAVVRGTSGAA